MLYFFSNILLPPFNICILFFVIALFFALLLNHLLLKYLHELGQARKRKNEANLVRWASSAKPAIGGFSFLILFLLSISAYFVLPLENSPPLSHLQIFGLISSSTLGFLVGLIDDTYNTPPSFKFFGQLACAALMIFSGVMIMISNSLIINVLITIFWVVGVMNSVNMLDNMDGITTSVGSIIVASCLFLLLSHNFANQSFYIIILVGVLAGLLGFLFFNWHPSKMYMGDTGSQFLGAFLAFISILFLWNFNLSNVEKISWTQSFLLPITLFLMSLIDTATVFIRRIARRQSPFVGGRDHTTHHLAYCGLKDGQVALFFVISSSVSAFLAFWIVNNWAFWTHEHTFLVLGYWVFVFMSMQFFYDKGKEKEKIAKRLSEKK